MIYELRIYRCAPGRMADVLKRFEEHVLGIWKRLGITQAGFWTVSVGDCSRDVYYMLRWNSLAEREQKWELFRHDPEWAAIRKATEKDGAIVHSVRNQFLAPTAFSASR